MIDYKQSELDAIRLKLTKAAQQLSDGLATVQLALVELDLLQRATTPISLLTPRPMPVITFPIPAPKPAEPEPIVEEPLIETEEWKTIKDVLGKGTEPVFITGGAGVGKTSLLHQVIEETDKATAVVAPTGVAALRAGGQTIHSFFGLPAEAIHEGKIRTDSSRVRSRLKGLERLIVDEASMVRADLMDGMNWSLQKYRGNTLPFGGVPVALFGDLFQLPPVVDGKDKELRKWLIDQYGTDEPSFFHAICWRDKLPAIYHLTKVFRQKDEAFVNALNAVRDGTLTQAQLDLLNQQVTPNFKPPDDDLWITLTTTNQAADYANQKMLARLTTEARTFEALVINFAVKDAPTDEHLTLKPGATVMFIRNDSERNGRRWVNGTLGKVTSVRPLRVAVDGIDYAVESETWPKIEYTFNDHTKKLESVEIGSFSQIPLKLAAAITIHKSQGCSMDRVIIDLGTGTFASGQLYTALSRCRTLEGIRLLRPLRMDDLLVSKEVQAFMKGEPIAKPQPSPLLLL